ncbi:sarcosine oxidase subunit gamma [Paraburkholderia caballeronis]|uniref:sarcosine oxidase subunit gamma n=1 Tax=Paraburkholderia caballeronis TaxID=416943 RepID=UPI001FBB6725|nr:sarcosine oxidase subunit gamma family protein [Paraburkholderia caballeronis]
MESPLVGLRHLADGARGAGVSLAERAGLDLVVLRGNPAETTFQAAVSREFDCEVPVEPNTVSDGKDYCLIWLGPDEWLARSKAPDRSSAEPRIAAALAGVFASAVDVSSGYTTLTVSGPNAAEVLARGCPLDLHPSVFRAGQCAQTHFFKASVLVLPVGDDAFDLIVRRSFAEYMMLMLLDARDSTFISQGIDQAHINT